MKLKPSLSTYAKLMLLAAASASFSAQAQMQPQSGPQGSSSSMSSMPSDPAMTRSESRQMIELTTPQARAANSRKEAQAAYQEAVSQCRQMGSDRSSCMQEARANLQNDLAEAKRMTGAETSVGR